MRQKAARERAALERCFLVGILSIVVLASCATKGGRTGKRLERAQTHVFEAPYDVVFPAVVEVLSRDYSLKRVESEGGAIETVPKPDVVLNTGAYQGVYNLKVRAEVSRLEGNRTKVRLRVLTGRLLDFAENRWEYTDFGTPQYYREYFEIIRTAVRKNRNSAK